MKRLSVFVLFLLLSWSIAQTQWEYARFSYQQIGSGDFNSMNIYFKDNTRSAVAGSWEEFAEQTDITAAAEPGAGYWGVIQTLGEEGFELVTYNSDTYLSETGNRIATQTWYFKRPIN